MNDHNLDDLIIGDPSPVGKKSKGLLAIIALIVIVLLAGILLSRMILDSDDDGSLATDQNQTEFVSPELIPTDDTKAQKRSDDLTPIGKEKLPTASKKVKKPTRTVSKKVVKKIIKNSEPVKKKVTTAKTTTKKVATKKPVAEKSKPSTLFQDGKRTYFIQIGAFNREPNSRFLKKIENAGLKYVVNKNEKTRRVRVGPYGSYSEAKAALTDVNSSIGIMGFVVEQK
ncbi:MAG: SPOR domain-containing protein [Sulfurovum sp.]|nr:SPOR domain-containing protein [Sulfurovum sp.]